MIIPDPTPGGIRLNLCGTLFGEAQFGVSAFGYVCPGLVDLPITGDGIGSRFGFARFGSARFGSGWGLTADTIPGGLTLTEDSHI